MVIVQMKGGLGNQMFQYALGLHLSIKFSEPLYFDLTDYRQQRLRRFELEVFGIHNKEVNAATRFFYHSLIKSINLLGLKSKSVYVEPTLCFDEKVFRRPYPRYYKGFFQSYKYFVDISSQLRERFLFVNSLDKANGAIASTISASNSISIHVRRGDYIYWDNYDSSHVLCGLDYYWHALELMKQKVNACTFFVFTDDTEWVRKNFKFEYVLVEGNGAENAWKDMHLMSLCKHHIIANSTFSWWAAWLNPSESKLVIAPKQWFGNQMNEETKDLCPPGWIRI
jgi:hypothetical protein